MSTFINLDDAIDLILLGNNDLLQMGKMRLRKFARFVYDDLQLSVIKQPKRQFFQIDKRTNSVVLPCTMSELSSVSVVDRHHNIYPVWRNEKLTGDIVDIAAGRDCACEHNCGYKLCNTMKSYEAITTVETDKLPDGSDISFTCVSRKSIDKGGNLIEQVQFPERVYEEGVWTDTILKTETKHLCAVEVDSNGCLCDTKENIDLVASHCGCNTGCGSNGIPCGGDASNPPCNDSNIDTWKYYCNTKLDWFGVQSGCEVGAMNPMRNIYNISEEGNRLIFPHDFVHDKVLVRFYEPTNVADIKLPSIAITALTSGLKWYSIRFDDNKRALAISWEQEYSKNKIGLSSMLRRNTIAYWRMVLSTPVFVPSYIIGRHY